MPSPGQHAVGAVERRPVADVNARDPGGVRRDPREHGRIVPDVIGVEQDPDLGRAALASTVSACASELTNPACSRCVACTGSKPTRTPREPAAAATLRSPSTRISVPSASGSAAERAREARDALGLVRREPRDRRAAAPRSRSAGSSGPSMPGIASGSTDGTSGTQTATRRPCSRSSAMFASSSGGQLELPEPDRVEPGGRICFDVLRERCVDGRDLGERENHERPGSFARSRCGDRRPRQLLRDEIAGAGAEAGPGVGARADVPEPRHGRLVAGRLRQRAPEQVLVERARAPVDVAADEVDVQRLEVGGGEDDALQGRLAEVLDRARRAARRSGRRTPRAAPPSTCRRRCRARRRRRP